MTALTRVRVLMSRVMDVVAGRRRDQRLSEEIQAHLDLLADEHVARGMTPAEARAAARRAFGGVDQVKAVYRDQRGLPFVDAVTQDLRFAVRLLRRDRGFAVMTVCVLGLGIGVNNMLFTILNAHTMRGLPIHRADRVVYISTFDDRTPERGLSHLDVEELRSSARSFVGLAAFSDAPVTVSGDRRAAERWSGTFASAGAFSLIGVQPVEGRGFIPEDDVTGAAPIVLLGREAWRVRYGEDRDVIGRSILVNGAPATVVGVMPDRSGFPSTAEVWLPLRLAPGLDTERRDARTLRVFGRVRDDVTIDAARLEIETITDRLSREHPETSKGIRARVVPINERFFGRWTQPTWLAFMTAGCLILLISCANVANLMLGRSVQRAREIAIRTSLGASRGRVIRQLLIEGGVLAACGGVLGLGLAIGGGRLLRSAIPDGMLPYWIHYSPDARVLAALVVVSFASLFVFALLPAARVSKTDVSRALKDGGRTATVSRTARRWTTAFLAAEFGLAVVLLAQVTVSLRIAAPPLPSDNALDTREILTATITLPAETYRTPGRRAELFSRLEERLGANPGVSSVSIASVLPLMGAPEQRLEIEGRPHPGGDVGTVRSVAIGPRYFETLGLALVRGRELSKDDGAPGQAHVIVNELFARQIFGDGDPIGRRIAVAPINVPPTPPAWLTVVGVSPAIRQSPSTEPTPIVYLPYRAAPLQTAALLVRSGVDAASLASLLRAEVLALDPNLPLYRMQTMAQVFRNAQWNGRVSHLLILVLTFIAVALSAVGLYAVTAQGVSERTHEIGVRMALGARPAQVVGMVVRRALLQLGLGFVGGVVLTMMWDRTFSSGRAGVTATDPESLTIVAALLAVVALIACFVPARRATRLDPVAAIRGD